MLPLGEVPPGELGRVERDALPPTDLEDSPDHPYVAADPPPLFVVVPRMLHPSQTEVRGTMARPPVWRNLERITKRISFKIDS